MSISRIRPEVPLLFWVLVWALVFGETVLAFASWQNKDAVEWTGSETHRVLNESPWSKSARLSYADTEVMVRWQSALPVRLALSKAAGGRADATNMEALNEYVIAVSGVPSRSLQMFGRDSGELLDNPTAVENQLKRATSLLRGGHEPIYAAKVEISPAGEERVMLFYFSKSAPIALADKEVEFRVAAARTQVKRKFALRDMKYRGKLEL